METLQAVKYESGKLKILDQLLLPHVTKYVDVYDTKDGWKVIRDMQVRGAPLIGVVGVLSLVAEIYNRSFTSVTELCDHVRGCLDYLVSARPTAVNMADMRNRINKQFDEWLQHGEITTDELKTRLIKFCEALQLEDVETNKSIGRHGADDVQKRCPKEGLKLLTHCNTGSLATAGYGTALGVVRTLYERSVLSHCYCTETRPYNQGCRLTAYELVHDGIPSTLICDDMVAALMKCRGVDAVVTGADRVASNGDTANKIGTYQIAIVARHHNVPFYIAAPSTSIDLNISSGDEIVIEERAASELTHIAGVPVAAPGINCWNPAFDVTPAELITGGIITEFGVFKPDQLKQSLLQINASRRHN